MRRRVKSVLTRLALVCLGLLVGVLALELLLRVGAAFTPARGDTGATWVAGARRIVCLGDSNTFGLYVGRQHAYPHVLEELWNQTPGRPPIEVLNLGYPGNNSSVLRNRIVDVIDLYRPDVVAIQIGVNDFWTAPEPTDDSNASRTFELRTWLWKHSRVFRLFYMVERAVSDRPAEQLPRVEEGKGRWAPVTRGVPEWRAAYRRNMAAMIGAVRDSGARPILLTYGASGGFYEAANEEIRAAAAENDVPLIDPTPRFDRDCHERACPLLLQDLHPSVDGHRVIGGIVLDELDRRGVFPPT